MKPTFIIKNKSEWMRLSKGVINIPYPTREKCGTFQRLIKIPNR